MDENKLAKSINYLMENCTEPLDATQVNMFLIAIDRYIFDLMKPERPDAAHRMLGEIRTDIQDVLNQIAEQMDIETILDTFAPPQANLFVDMFPENRFVIGDEKD